MDFIDEIQALSIQIRKNKKTDMTEEATKHAFVLPFIKILGYNVFDPSEVIPEFTADVGTKKGEKVDYAIQKEKKIIMLFECKPIGTKLDKGHVNQLFRYFSVTESRIAVLTNGIIYRFFTDLKDKNKMDSRPFLEITLDDLQDDQILELKRFKKEIFNIDKIAEAASDLKYAKEIKRVLLEQFDSPSHDFVKLVTKSVYSGRRMNSKVQDQFKDITKRAIKQLINDKISDLLKTAMEQESADEKEEAPSDEEVETKKDGIVTTEDEIEGYHIVRAILHEIIDVGRVVMRDKKSYCGILLDDNNRKPICRFHFNQKQYYFGLFDKDKTEEKIPIDKLADIYKYADRLKGTLPQYDKSIKINK